jgi:hypothetical protein
MWYRSSKSDCRTSIFAKFDELNNNLRILIQPIGGGQKITQNIPIFEKKKFNFFRFFWRIFFWQNAKLQLDEKLKNK